MHYSAARSGIAALVALAAGGAMARADQVIPDDLIVQGSICVGFDCVNGEAFSFDTLRMRENNLRIGFDDTSVGTFPSNDWEIRINDSANGGNSYFAIVDVTAGQTVFQVCAVADVGCTNIIPGAGGADPQTAINTAGIATNAGNIAINAAGIATNAGNVAANTAGIATNAAGIATNAAGIATNASGIAALQGTVTGLTGQIGALQTSVAGHSGRIGTLETTVTGHSGQIGTLQTTVAGHSTQIGTLQTTVAGHGTRIGGLEVTTARHTSQIGRLQSVTADHGARIGTLEGTTAALGGRVSGLENRMDRFSGDLRAVKSGVAVAIAMGNGVALDSDREGAVEVNLGTFDGETAIGLVGAVRLDSNLTMNLGLGSAMTSGTTGGRIGLQYTW